MRTIRIIEHISLDGVIQSPGGHDEDRDDAFAHGGWIVPHADPAIRDAIDAAQGDSFDLLLGRRTYDIWSGHWPQITNHPFARCFNAATKYVATHRPSNLGWGPVQALGSDIVAAVRDLRAGPGPDLLVWGSSTLTPLLLEQGLVDEVVLLVYPVLLGRGKRFFADGFEPHGLALLGTQATASGVMISTYRSVGPLRRGSTHEPSTK